MRREEDAINRFSTKKIKTEEDTFSNRQLSYTSIPAFTASWILSGKSE